LIFVTVEKNSGPVEKPIGLPQLNVKHDAFDGLSYLTNGTGTGNNLRTKRPKYPLYRTKWPKSVLWYIYRLTERLYQCLMSNQNGDFTGSKKFYIEIYIYY